MSDEFEFIRNVKKKYGLTRVGDDCAVMPKDRRKDLVITADMLVEDIDFRLEWTTPEFLGEKALAVSLSDIAAMGAAPVWAMLSIAVPKRIWESNFLAKFYKGWTKLASSYVVELIGGDISGTGDKLVIDSVVAGEVPRGNAMLRSGATPGDHVFVTGSLGAAAAGLKLLDAGSRHGSERGSKRRSILRQLTPSARVEAGQIIRGRRLATAMIDISDGLAADLHHLCEASGVGARIEAARLPVDRDLKHLDQDEALELALSGGEDFELLFTSSRKTFSPINSLSVTRIGIITEHRGIVELISDGGTTNLPALGYRHF